MVKLGDLGEISPQDYLLQYLEGINNFFERAKTYDPLLDMSATAG